MNQKLKDKIREANSKKEWIETRCYNGEEYSDDVPITLADVLIAIRKRHKLKINVVRMRLDIIQSMLLEKYDLEDDNLDHQSKECLTFLSDLLL